MPLDDSSAVFCVFPKEKVLPFPISYILCYEKTEWFNYHHDGNKQETIFQ